VSKSIRSLSALGAVLFALVGLAACGGIPGDAVVQVSGTPITKTAFNHWMSVAASSRALGAGEKPALLEPPNYTTCIAHLAATSPKPAKGQKAPTHAQLKSECEQEYKSLQTEVLGFLISSQWVLGEAESLGVKLSDAQVKKEFAKIKDAQYPKAAEFEKFLATSGETVSDLLLRIKLNLLSSKIQKQVVRDKDKVTEAQITKYYNEHKSRFTTPAKRGKPSSQESLSQVKSTIKQQLISTNEQSALGKFVDEFKEKWTAKTDCRAAYVMMDCKQYKAAKISVLSTGTGTAVPQTSTKVRATTTK
jgi:foldase protein PrsA